jgi:hypothetical protein
VWHHLWCLGWWEDNSSMAATHRLKATTLSSIDGVSFTALSGHQSFSSSLEKSINVRDSPKEGRVMLLGGGKPSAASQNGELQPMTTAVLLDLVSVIDLKPYQLDLHRVINAAAGAPIDDPQSRPLKACGVEKLKRVQQCLVESEKQARRSIAFQTISCNCKIKALSRST